MITKRELEIYEKFEAGDYATFMKESENVASDWLLPYGRYQCFIQGLGVEKSI